MTVPTQVEELKEIFYPEFFLLQSILSRYFLTHHPSFLITDHTRILFGPAGTARASTILILFDLNSSSLEISPTLTNSQT